MQLLRVACVLSAVQAFVGTRARIQAPPRHRRDINYGTQVAPLAARRPVAVRGAPEDAADAKIDSFVKDNKVMLFMKGTKIFPQCGFSNMAVQILNAIGADFETCDVLSDDFIRQQIKVYSDWPTIPQLYVDGEFVGGSDIMLEMYQAGELQEMIEVAAAS